MDEKPTIGQRRAAASEAMPKSMSRRVPSQQSAISAGFKIAVNHPMRVQIFERLTKHAGDFQRVLLRQRMRAIENMGQGATAQ